MRKKVADSRDTRIKDMAKNAAIGSTERTGGGERGNNKNKIGTSSNKTKNKTKNGSIVRARRRKARATSGKQREGRESGGATKEAETTKRYTETELTKLKNY